MTQHPLALTPLLLVLLLTPRVGLAGQEQPAPLPEDAPLVSPREPVPEDPRKPYYDPYAPPVRERPHVALRVLAETGAGLLTGVAGGVAGVNLVETFCKGPGLACLGPELVGLTLGASAGFSLGVLWGGAVVGNNGHLLGALSGTGLVLGGALLVGALFARADDDTRYTALVGTTGILLPVGAICSILVYEATGSDGARPRPAPTARKSGGVRLQPTLAFSSRGARVGLGGTF